MAEHETAKKLSNIIAGVASSATILGAVMAVNFLFDAGKEAVLDVTLDEIESRVESIVSKKLSDLRIDIDTAIADIIDTETLPENTELAIRMRSINKQMESLQAQLEIVRTIEIAVTDNPERAMSIPILRKDVDLLRTDLIDDLETIRSEVDRVYDLGKWFLGLIGTMAIGVLGLVAGNLLRRPE